MHQTLLRSEVQQPVTIWLNHYSRVLPKQLLLCRSSFYLSFRGFSPCISIKGLLFELPEKAVSRFFFFIWNYIQTMLQKASHSQHLVASCLFMTRRSSEGSVSSGCLEAKAFALYCPVLHLSILIGKMLTKGLSIAMETLHPISL